MKRTVLAFALVVIVVLGFGCGNEQAVQPTSTPNMDGVGQRVTSGLVPGGYYSLASSENGYTEFGLISQRNGLMTHVWSLSGQFDWIADPPPLFESPLGLAFDLDGSIYTVVIAAYFEPDLCQSRFARIDPLTGHLTYIGDPVPFDYCGGDIDSHGTFYVCGMDVPHLGYIHGPGSLFTVDKATGTFTEIGPTVWNGPDVLIDPPVYHGERITDWMDLAFDSHDQLYGTTRNKLFSINTTTGEITAVIPIRGVPGDPPPPPNTLIQEVMSIAFDDDDVLFGTAMNVEWDTGHGSPVMRINKRTGRATLLGYTEQPYNHGGDILLRHPGHNQDDQGQDNQ